jgi:hypothetical protein
MLNELEVSSFLPHTFNSHPEARSKLQSMTSSSQKAELNETIIAFVSKSLLKYRKAQLTSREECVLEALLEEQTYLKAGKDNGYSEGTLQNAASKLFKDLSSIFDRDITRRNCQVIITEVMALDASQHSLSTTSQTTINIDLWMLVNHCQLITLRSTTPSQEKRLLQSFFYRYYGHFHRAIWLDINLFESFRAVLADLITTLNPMTDLTYTNIDRMQELLMECLREQRCLIAIDCSACASACGKNDFCHQLFMAMNPHRHSSSFVANCHWQPPHSEQKPFKSTPQQLSIKTTDTEYLEIVEKLVFGQQISS